MQALVDAAEGAPSGELGRRGLLRGWTVLICAPSGRERAVIPEWVAERGGLPRLAEDCQEMARALAAPGAGPTLVTLVTSAQCRREEVAERCRALRAVAPEVPIVVVSPACSRNDFTADRDGACDAVLACPVTGWAFGTAAATAIANFRRRTGGPGAPGTPARVAPAAEPSGAGPARHPRLGRMLMAGAAAVAALGALALVRQALF